MAHFVCLRGFGPHADHKLEAAVGGGSPARQRQHDARATAQLSDRWGLMLRGDGSFGDSEGGYNASAIFQYHTGGGLWALGYRYMSVELGTGSGESLDLTLSGPIVGYVFKF